MEKVIDIDSAEAYNSLYGLETVNPLVSVVDLRKATRMVDHVQFRYGVYALFLKNGKECELKYGRRPYDYQEGTVTSFAPGQVVEVNMLTDNPHPEVYGLVFHPDLIRGTSLGRDIRKYGFFSYSSDEALHLSESERAVVTECLSGIDAELRHASDRHSRRLIVLGIELLLGHCLRFYERQFVTRERVNKEVIQKFETGLDDYLATPDNVGRGLPSVKYFADMAHLSPNYFGDLVKKETGCSAQELIRSKVVERGKDLLLSTGLSVSEIAYNLGFSYPQHFSRMFRQVAGITPGEFRNGVRA